MDTQSKPTPGRWQTAEVFLNNMPNRLVVRKQEWAGATVADLGAAAYANRADGELIAEAGTVYNETGLTPRQLLAQRDALMTALENLLLWDDGAATGPGDLPGDVIAEARAAVIKAKAITL